MVYLYRVTPHFTQIHRILIRDKKYKNVEAFSHERGFDFLITDFVTPINKTLFKIRFTQKQTRVYFVYTNTIEYCTQYFFALRVTSPI